MLFGHRRLWCRLLRRGEQRQSDHKLAAAGLAVRRAVRFDRAAVQRHQPLREREADPQAPRRAVQRAIGLREQVEDLRQELFIDPYAVVAHADLGMVLLASVFAPDLDAAFLGPCTWRRCRAG